MDSATNARPASRPSWMAVSAATNVRPGCGILPAMTHAITDDDSPVRTRLLPALLVALVAFAAAWIALLPGLAFWDTGELQAVAPLMGTAHPTGFPTYVLLGWLASVVLQPFGEPAFRMNLFSAICVAVAAGMTVDLVRKLTGWTILGIAAGIGLALTPIVWAIATHAEAHSLHLALLAILLWLLVTWEERVKANERGERPGRGDRFLVAATIVYGLAVGNHSLTLLLAIPVGLYVLAVDPRIWRRGRLVLGCVAALALTVTLVYLELPLRAGPFRAALVYGTPNTWDGFRYVVLAEQFQGSLSDPFGELPRKFGELVEPDGRPVRHPGAAHPDRIRRHRHPTATLRPADRDRGGHHLLLRGVLRQRRHQSLLPRPGAAGLDLAGHPRRGRDRSARHRGR